MTETEEIIRTILVSIGQAPVPSSATASLYDAGVIDSFGVIDLVSSLEKAFNFQVEDQEMVPMRFQTIAQITEFVAAKLQQNL